MPTGTEDPDLALIVGIWDRLAVDFKRRLIAIIRVEISKHVRKLVDEGDEE